MKYALLAYGAAGESGRRAPGIEPALAQVLSRPAVEGWIRLHDTESATSVRGDAVKPLLSDGPFIDSKEHLGGLILVDAESLDDALALAAELCGHMRGEGGIEIRPILEQKLADA